MAMNMQRQKNIQPESPGLTRRWGTHATSCPGAGRVRGPSLSSAAPVGSRHLPSTVCHHEQAIIFGLTPYCPPPWVHSFHNQQEEEERIRYATLRITPACSEFISVQINSMGYFKLTITLRERKLSLCQVKCSKAT
jgi:hypothetical protein